MCCRLKNFRRVFKTLAAAVIFILAVIIAVFPERYLKSSFCGIKLWAFSVLPSLLPYFFLTTMLTKLNVLGGVFKKFDKPNAKLFRVNGIVSYAFFSSVISGYPVGAKILSDLYAGGLISEGEVKRAAPLCSTSGPLFIIGAVGVSMFLSKAAGVIMLISHVLSAVFTALTFRGVKGEILLSDKTLLPKKCDNILYESAYGAVNSVLIVGAYVTVFFVISDILIDFKVLMPLSFILKPIFSIFGASGNEYFFISGLIECTKGAKLLSLSGATSQTVALTASLISFGGVSVVMQSLTYLSGAKVKPLYFLAVKSVQAFYAFLLAFLAGYLFL